MKRSEIIKILTNIIHSETDAKDILDIIEKAGMAPPINYPTMEELGEEDEDCYNELLYFNEYRRWDKE